MAVPDVPVPGTRTDVSVPETASDRTGGHCHSVSAGWAILVVGVLSMAGVIVLALTNRPEAATALGSTAAAVCTVGGSLLMHRR
jgi:hypothetical protein